MKQTRLINYSTGVFGLHGGNVDPINGDGSGTIIEENKDFRHETVQLDGKLFLNCRFENCLLTYGGAFCEWEGSTFFNCRILLNDSAGNTATVLQGLGFSIIGVPRSIAST